MHPRQDVGAEMPGEPVGNKIATVFVQQCLGGNGSNLTRGSDRSQEEVVAIHAARQQRRGNFPLKRMPIVTENCPWNTPGQVLLPCDKDQTMHRTYSRSPRY